MTPDRLSLLALLLLAAACGDDTAPTADQYPAVAVATTLDLGHPADYTRSSWPPFYTAQVLAQSNTPAGNPITDRGATLGRVLFHDRHLSRNDTKSCASCHDQGRAFSDAAQFSLGFGGVERTTAHSMRLANARFYAAQEMFWDRRAPTLEAQATQPIRHAVEMGFDDEHGGIDSLLAKMQGLAYYPELFAWVFGDSTITEDRIQRALAQYVRSIVSADSKFDRTYASAYNAAAPNGGILAPFPGFTEQENLGKSLFLRPVNQGGAGCAGCHVPPTFALAANSGSNGLDAGEFRTFKAPSLKDVGVTGPYMHDGRFTSLGQVVGHYMRGVQDGPALDDRLRGPGGAPQRLLFEPSEENAIVAFLLTLTDQSLPTDPRFTDPFRP
ncbi:MAG TPA: cytochrome c peroxidase [Gemmatimonadales bacterium]|nr:cytochrome c peroxidase [Gemmatimonadales bacterium]